MAHEFVFGLIGPSCSHKARKVWNDAFRQRGIDGFFDFYRSNNRGDLELRLSHMFLLDRRGYIVDKKFEKEILPLLDELDSSAKKKGSANTILNKEGVMVGFYVEADVETGIEERIKIWL